MIGEITVALSDNEINRRVDYHPPTDKTKPLYETNRARIGTMMHWWNQVLPDSREKTLALDALQQASMWANAAIACNQKRAGE